MGRKATWHEEVLSGVVDNVEGSTGFMQRRKVVETENGRMESLGRVGEGRKVTWDGRGLSGAGEHVEGSTEFKNIRT